MSSERTVKVGIYGAGDHARNNHLLNLIRLEDVEVVAVCDIVEENARQVAADFGIPRRYTDGHEMVKNEPLDALWSTVVAAAREDGVEVAAAEKGIHLFIEKPQAMDMGVAYRIDDAIRHSGVFSTVCFRERYRPIFQEAKRLLQDKKIVHIRFQMISDLPARLSAGEVPRWDGALELRAPFFGWGPHALDYCRYMSGLDMVRAQAFFHHPEQYEAPLSSSFNFTMSNGATMTMTFLSASPGQPAGEPYFLFYYEGGYLGVHNYSYIDMNGERVFTAEDFNPWFEGDRVFVEAIRTGDGSGILNDYHDGLCTLAPLLAGWESARRDGKPVDVPTFMHR